MNILYLAMRSKAGRYNAPHTPQLCASHKYQHHHNETDRQTNSQMQRSHTGKQRDTSVVSQTKKQIKRNTDTAIVIWREGNVSERESKREEETE